MMIFRKYSLSAIQLSASSKSMPTEIPHHSYNPVRLFKNVDKS